MALECNCLLNTSRVSEGDVPWGLGFNFYTMNLEIVNVLYGVFNTIINHITSHHWSVFAWQSESLSIPISLQECIHVFCIYILHMCFSVQSVLEHTFSSMVCGQHVNISRNVIIGQLTLLSYLCVVANTQLLRPRNKIRKISKMEFKKWGLINRKFKQMRKESSACFNSAIPRRGYRPSDIFTTISLSYFTTIRDIDKWITRYIDYKIKWSTIELIHELIQQIMSLI